MYRLETDRSTYQSLKIDLAEVRPDIKVELVVCDIVLEKLGFCNSAPCIVNIHLDEEEMENLQLDFLNFEIDAFNGNDEPEDDDPLYVLYKKYGWLYYLFLQAELIEDNK